MRNVRLFPIEGGLRHRVGRVCPTFMKTTNIKTKNRHTPPPFSPSTLSNTQQ